MLMYNVNLLSMYNIITFNISERNSSHLLSFRQDIFVVSLKYISIFISKVNNENERKKKFKNIS